MAENRLFWGFVEKKVAKVSKLALNEIRWATVGKYPTFSIFKLNQLSRRRKMRLEQVHLLN